MADLTPHKTAIIGCGNTNRSDDGVGSRVINILRGHALPNNISLYDAGTDGMGVMYQARGVSRLIIVDAKGPENNPGAIYEVPGEILEAPPPQSLNLHDFRWDHALFAGRKIYGEEFPGDVTVLLIEAEILSLGLSLSDAVERAAHEVASRIVEMVAQKEAAVL